MSKDSAVNNMSIHQSTEANVVYFEELLRDWLKKEESVLPSGRDRNLFSKIDSPYSCNDKQHSLIQ